MGESVQSFLYCHLMKLPCLTWRLCACALVTIFTQCRILEAQDTRSWYRQISGRINVNDRMYPAVCDCSGKFFNLTSACGPSRINIKPLQYGHERFTAHDLKLHLGDVGDLKAVDVTLESFSCIDGRSSDEILGTPGGDAQEFIHALIAYQEIGRTNYPIWIMDVKRYLSRYLNGTQRGTVVPGGGGKKRYRYMYYHTDYAAVERLRKFMNEPNLDITNPAPHIPREVLLSAVSQPEHVGCRHIRRLLSKSNPDSVTSMTELFLQAMYQILWDKSTPLYKRIKHVILAARPELEQKALVHIRSSNLCLAAGYAFPFPPYQDDVSLYIQHPNAALSLREDLANYFHDLANPKDDAKVPDLKKRSYELAREAMEAFIIEKGEKLPIYAVTIE